MLQSISRMFAPPPTFAFVAHQWLAAAKLRLRPSWHADIDSLLRRHILPQIGNRRVSTLTKSDIRAVLANVPPGLHNHCLGVIKQITEFVDEDGPNPTRGIRRRPTGKRERVLSLRELAAVWNGVEGMRCYRSIVRLLILTGCRREEIGRLAWREITREPHPQIELPPARCKNGKAHIIPLAPLALAQIPLESPTDQDVRAFAERGLVVPRCPYLFGLRYGKPFNGWDRCKEKLDERVLGMAHWCHHDLRRSMVTHCNELGLAPPHIIEAFVNHTSGPAKAGICGVYNRAAYLAERRKLAEDWAAVVRGIVGSP